MSGPVRELRPGLPVPSPAPSRSGDVEAAQELLMGMNALVQGADSAQLAYLLGLTETHLARMLAIIDAKAGAA